MIYLNQSREVLPWPPRYDPIKCQVDIIVDGLILGKDSSTIYSRMLEKPRPQGIDWMGIQR